MNLFYDFNFQFFSKFFNVHLIILRLSSATYKFDAIVVYMRRDFYCHPKYINLTRRTGQVRFDFIFEFRNSAEFIPWLRRRFRRFR